MSAHTPGSWNVSYEKRGFLGAPDSDMKKFHTIEACHQPKGVNGRSLVLAEMRVGDESFGFGDDAIRRRVDDDEAQANAAFICRAVNAHADLVAALEGVIRVADRATVEFDAARAALKKAKGESA